MDTYSRKPFITYDKIDENGVRAEVKVVTGLGVVEKITPSDKGKSAKIDFRVENTKYLPSGWAPIDDPVYKVAEEALKSGEIIHFRIETRRKDGVSRSTPMDDLTPRGDMSKSRENTFKSFAAAKRADDENWTLSPHIRTRLEEDPAEGSTENPYDMSLASFTGGQPISKPAAGVNNGIEKAPYITMNNDGTLNPGSIAVSVPLNLYSFIVEYERNNSELGVLSDKQRIALVKVLLHTANALQIAIYDGKLDKPDLSAGSHTRARALLFEVIRTFYPVTPELVSSKENLLEWKGLLFEKALAMWRWSISEVESSLN